MSPYRNFEPRINEGWLQLSMETFKTLVDHYFMLVNSGLARSGAEQQLVTTDI